jgi:hypothetical protein
MKQQLTSGFSGFIKVQIPQDDSTKSLLLQSAPSVQRNDTFSSSFSPKRQKIELSKKRILKTDGSEVKQSD